MDKKGGKKSLFYKMLIEAYEKQERKEQEKVKKGLTSRLESGIIKEK